MDAQSRLAILGGDRAVPRGTRPPAWPVIGEPERAAVLGVLDSGRFTGFSAGEPEIPALEREWAARVGSAHCVAVANGTAALAIALAAAGVRPGEEVIVPALGFAASALAPVQVGAVPVFVDVDPVTFTLDPGALDAARSARTAAVIPVHLHGVPADMAEIGGWARRHGISVIEDAAQSHGVEYRGAVTGSLGDLGAFSLNVSKNLPTCGEGGLITTDDAQLARRAVQLRQFGEAPPATGRERGYLSELPGWNAKMNALQAAFARAQLTRFEEQSAVRDRNVRTLLGRIAECPGLVVPSAPADRGHGWHILRFRVRPESFGLAPESAGALRAAILRVLRGEGVPASRYQTIALGRQPVFRDGRAASRTLPVPVTDAVVEDSFCLQRAHLNPDALPLLLRFADAFDKLWAHRDVVAAMAVARGTGPAEAAA